MRGALDGPKIKQMTRAARTRREPVGTIQPGEMLLEEFLLPAGKTQAAFAREVGWTKARLNELIKGKRGVTAGEGGGTCERTECALAQPERRHTDVPAGSAAKLGKRSQLTALDLVEALGTSPRLWMNLQATFDLAAALQKRRAA